MRCSICGCENENSAEKCSVCGSILTPESEAKNKKTISTSTSGELVDKSKSTKRFVICGVIIIAIVITAIAGFFIARHNSVKKDEKLIIGTWEADISNDEDDLTFGDYKYITFYSNGTGEITTVYGEAVDMTWGIEYEFDSWNIIHPNNTLSVSMDQYYYLDSFYLFYDLDESYLTIQNWYGPEKSDYTPVDFLRISAYNSNSSSNDGFTSNLFKSDEDRILGDWVLDTSYYGEGLDKLANLNGVIVEITFLSDGTCTVDGTSSPESGVWSIVDGQLKVQGTMGGMFWNYNGFLADYDLNGDTLTLYGDDGENDYVYYRE